MKKSLLVIFFLFLILFGSRIETGEEKRDDISCQQEIYERDPITTMEKAVKITLFAFLVPVILFFVAFMYQYIKNVTFKHRSIKEKFKYRKQMPRSELALNINIG